jgi:hypothetical protein
MTEDTLLPGNLHRAQEQIEQMLIAGETLQAAAPQIWLFSLFHRRAVVVATSGRFIGIRRGLFGGFTPVDVRWQDVRDVTLKVGVFAATLVVQANDPADLATSGDNKAGGVFGGLEKRSAQAVYRICQAQEQAWREKRRIRELEELRAKSGGIQLGAGGLGTAAPAGDLDVVGRLEKAREMLQKGLISDSEYEAMKARIISTV